MCSKRVGMKTYQYKITNGKGEYILYFKTTSRRKADSKAMEFRHRGGSIEFIACYPSSKLEELSDPQNMGIERLVVKR
jgi:hypothetical protein